MDKKLTITGWNSHEMVKIHIVFFNNHISVCGCKALDCAWLCRLLEHNDDVNYYQVLHNDILQPPDYLEFSDTYPKWRVNL